MRLSQFSAGSNQGQLFASERELKEHELFDAVDRIRDRHGKDILFVGPGVKKLTAERQLEAMSTAGIPSAFMHGRD